MKKIGLVGEDPNDTSAIENLLNQKYITQAKFIKLAKRIRGSQLDTDKLKKQVVFDFKYEKCDFVICIRDLDGLESENDKIIKRLNWHSEIESSVKKSLILLNIWELEALIYADIEIFNKIYNSTIKFRGNPEFIKAPKEELIRKTRNNQKEFHENHCPDIFKELRFENIMKNSKSFKNFIAELEKQLVV